MELSAHPVEFQEVLPWRDLYRQAMNCQIVHDSLHARDGWALEYVLDVGDETAGYGSILIGGPWKNTRTLFEFYVLPQHRSRAFALFDCLLGASNPTAMEIQSNDALLAVMFHAYAKNIASEKIVFADKLTTFHSLEGVIFRRREEADGEWVLELNGAVVANGGVLYHYNRPYGDIYMQVEESYRRRGLGALIVQELKKICYQGGSIPGARCNTDNVASRQTLQKAGFVPFAHMLTGSF
jgi:GNAT superfamily N-acetyltransferase